MSVNITGLKLLNNDTESGESVTVGNHNSELISAMKSLQYGDESFSLPVEASGGVVTILVLI